MTVVCYWKFGSDMCRIVLDVIDFSLNIVMQKNQSGLTDGLEN